MKSAAAVFAQAFEQGQEAFVGIDAAGTIVAWNRAAEQLFGYAAAAAVGRPLALLGLPDRTTGLAAGAPERIESLRHRNGREVRVALRRIALAPGEKEVSWLLSAVDVGERHQAEEKLAGSREALAASRSELRRLAARRVAAEEEARWRVARELHDDLGQRVTAAAIELKVVRRRIPDGDPLGPDLSAVGGLLADLGEDLRRLSHELHPAALERCGLVAALRDHCVEVARRFDLAIRLSLCEIDGALPQDVALGLYRCAQEGLANVVRHSAARTVHVTLMKVEGAMQLSLVDDGVGFDPVAARAIRGLGLASLEERAELLGGACRIVSAPGAGTEIEVTVPASLESDFDSDAAPGRGGTRAGELPRQLGPYRLLEEIGRGAATVVYLAEEPAPLSRRVAIKLHQSPLPGRPETLRFKAEQQALARLHHPAIAEVYEARTTPDGDPYIVMEYVPGLAIDAYCDRYALDLRRRLELFATVCGGVQHAHQKGILHRALSPSNLRVMEDGGVALPKIIDFGVAKGLDRPLAESTVWTPEDLEGDLAYLAPEALDGGEIDARAEVYSLGAVLYELLVGAVPIEVGEGGIAARLDPDRRAIGYPVPPPSERLASRSPDTAAEIVRRRGFSRPGQLRRRVAGDLDRIAAKALALDPAERYPTVEALGLEVERALSGQPVEAGGQGPLPSFGRFLRRHRRIAVAAALLVLALLGGWLVSAREARRAAEEATRADAVAQFLEDLFKASDPRVAKGAPANARDLLRRGTERLGTALANQPLLRARLLDSLGGIHTDLGLYAQARPLLTEALAIREKLRGPDHPEVAATLLHLGALAQLSGEGDPESLFRRALAIREKSLGEGAPEVVEALNKLGIALAAKGRLADANPILHRALDLAEKLWGAEDPRVAKILHNLSGLALYRGETAEAERLLERALSIREKSLPKDDLDLAGSREALAVLRLRQGRAAEAEALLVPLVATAERVYGPEHPDFARALLNLALARSQLGQDAEASRLFEQALAIFDRTLAPEHPMVVRALAKFADHHFNHQRYREAEPLYRRLVELRQRGAVPEEWDRSLDNYARLLRIEGREAEAARVPVGVARGGGP